MDRERRADVVGRVGQMKSERHDAYRKLAQRMVEKFFLPHEDSESLLQLRSLERSLVPPYSELAKTFDANLLAVLATVGMPLSLASAASEDRHWQRIYSRERIRALLIDSTPEEDQQSLDARREAEALKRASDEMEEFARSPEGKGRLAGDTCEFLVLALESKSPRTLSLRDAAAELLLQGAVLTWCAFETLCRDLFEQRLNGNPHLALEVMREPSAKNRLQSKFTLDEISCHGFDLSRSLGTVLASQQDFSDIRTIRAAVIPSLNSDATAALAVNDNQLWLLCQQRHVIVHRRGIIDARYLEATGADVATGSHLTISPAGLQVHLDAVAKAGLALLSATTKK